MGPDQTRDAPAKIEWKGDEMGWKQHTQEQITVRLQEAEVELA
jgi:hypothetical protein